MTERATALIDPPEGYDKWLAEVKARVRAAQQRAALAVNTELLQVYWQIGRDILDQQAGQGWGVKVVERLSHDLRQSFPDLGGFSRANLMYMRAFAEAWPESAIVQQPVGQLPWGHNIMLLTKLKDSDLRLSYAEAAVEFGWSRNVLGMHIERKRIERQGKAQTNFGRSLPKPDSDLARESLKDPYRLDFLGLGGEAHEREIEASLIEHITEFLLELGAGFAFVGQQVQLEVNGDDFYLDLLFYHLRLRRYVVVELKAEKFKPEHLGQLSFYMTAVDEMLRHEVDGPTIGLLLCKSKNTVVAEWALRDNAKPLSIAEYQLVEALPEPLQTALPTIEQIERELGEVKEPSKFTPARG
ncbi:MAG: PDDEXK nuclease domain-containing protein [Promicromonosporaceae bacterium]|nr:PDDEXK nuclease domain-containing protein [Promicromonosporaceae bacterium]